MTTKEDGMQNTIIRLHLVESRARTSGGKVTRRLVSAHGTACEAFDSASTAQKVRTANMVAIPRKGEVA